jgi:hypothetical protein
LDLLLLFFKADAVVVQFVSSIRHQVIPHMIVAVSLFDFGSKKATVVFPLPDTPVITNTVFIHLLVPTCVNAWNQIFTTRDGTRPVYPSVQRCVSQNSRAVLDEVSL